MKTAHRLLLIYFVFALFFIVASVSYAAEVGGVYQFAQDYVGVVVSLCSLLGGLVWYFWRQNSKTRAELYKARQTNQDIMREKELEALQHLIEGQAKAQEITVKQIEDLSNDFHDALEKTVFDFKESISKMQSKMVEQSLGTSRLWEKYGELATDVKKIKCLDPNWKPDCNCGKKE